MPTAAERAARRREEWTGEVVDPEDRGQDGSLYAALTPEERMKAMAALCQRAWLASGRPMPAPLPRDQWPGEVFEIERRG